MDLSGGGSNDFEACDAPVDSGDFFDTLKSPASLLLDLLQHPSDWPKMVPWLEQLRAGKEESIPRDLEELNRQWTETEQARLERWLERLPAAEQLPLAVEPVLWLLLSMARRFDSVSHEASGWVFHPRLKDLVVRHLDETCPSPSESYLPWLDRCDASFLQPRTRVALRLTARRLLQVQVAAKALRGAGWRDLRQALQRIGDPQNSSIPAWVVGRPSMRPAAMEHRDRLAGLLKHPQRQPGGVDLFRSAYHADWLHQLLVEAPCQGPMVSVIIPCHNRAHLLLEAVQTCLEQTFSHLEILVVDDGSEDDLREVLHPVVSRVRYVRMERNQGAAIARNFGIRCARGNLIHFLDADDLLHPETVERKIEALRWIPDAGLVFSGADQRGRVHYEAPPMYLANPPRKEHCPTRRLIDPAALAYPFLTSTVLIPRWQLEAVGLFDSGLRRGQDTELFFRLGLADVKAIGIAQALTIRRVVSSSLSAQPPDPEQIIRLRALNLIHLLENKQWIPEFALLAVGALCKAERLAVFAGADEFSTLRIRLLQALHEGDLSQVCGKRFGDTTGSSLRELFTHHLAEAITAIPALESQPFLLQLSRQLQQDGA